MIQDPDNKWMKFVNRMLDELDPHVAKMTALNLGFEAAFYGTKNHPCQEKRASVQHSLADPDGSHQRVQFEMYRPAGPQNMAIS